MTAIARTLADAKHYLVNRLTKQASVVVKGESRRLRILDRKGLGFFPEPGWTPDVRALEGECKLEFWDGEHGLQPGDQISIELPAAKSHTYPSVLKGIVQSVAAQKVSITGSDT